MTQADCPFCRLESDRIFHAGELVLGIWDKFPVSPGHALLIPKRHVASWFEATEAERVELLASTEVARDAIAASHAPDGFNLGVNIGEAAGQTVFHLHLHVIPRYEGDTPDPRGGVRHVIPARGIYDESVPGGGDLAREVPRVDDPEPALIRGENDPLLPHLRAHLDAATEADMAIAFVLASGVSLLEAHLRDLLERGGRLRLVTGDYLDSTDPNALLKLLDLAEQYPDRVVLRAFETANSTSFHPKAYIFGAARGAGVAFVGSSNLTRTALQTGLEWNYRVVPSADQAGFTSVRRAFEALLTHPSTRALDANWIQQYRARRRPVLKAAPVEVASEAPEPVPEPHTIQREALDALRATREAGNKAGLVVLATGLGKTWLSAFDSVAFRAGRILFVAHRGEILNQAMATYRRIRPDATLGLYTGQEKAAHADVLFASIQTLGRARHLERFAADAFDYIVVDEFHHAAAKTYRRLLDHFEPGFLLGLTATPDRTDGGDLLALCGENLVYDCDLVRGIQEELLAPFRYFGVPDDVDYSNIPWRSRRFDEEALTNAVATQARAENALDQYRRRGGSRTLAFCCSKRHADFMSSYFNEHGVDAVAVHSGPASAPRSTSLKELEAGDLPVVFAVDMFNEGVDLPNIDTVMMLRPTESRILWLQQFGRGLRRAKGKKALTVVDYIGNHRSFLLKPQTLLDLGANDHEVSQALERLEKGEFDLPPGCEVTYELEAMEILRSLLRVTRGADALRWWYADFKDRVGARPTAVEAYHEGYSPRSVRRHFGSWLRFVAAMGDLPQKQASLLDEGMAGGFLDAMETTAMTKSYKMLTALAMLNADRLPGEVTAAKLAEGVARLAGRSARLKVDLTSGIDDLDALRGLLEKFPLRIWSEGRDTPGGPYFQLEEGRFRTLFDVDPAIRDSFQELVRELVEWRLAEYLARPSVEAEEAAGRFLCKVSHANQKPIVFLGREANPGLPEGWTPILADGAPYEANFVKVAVNVVRKPGGEKNELPGLMRRWFGHDAGLPGTDHRVFFANLGGDWVLEPLRRGGEDEAQGLETGRAYTREEIPPLFDLEFKTTVWQQGFIWQGQSIFLLVTLEKKGQPAQHQYEDRFLSRELFQWQSQNRHNQEGKAGQGIRHHEERGISVHLFVRRSSKQGSRAAPFLYCGLVDFVSWEGEKPITVQWRLHEPLTDHIAARLGVEE